MKPDSSALKNALRRREAELQKLLTQMKQDNLHSSPVFKNLAEELDRVKHKITVK